MDRNHTYCLRVFVALTLSASAPAATAARHDGSAVSARALIDSLERVYSNMDLERYGTLFANAAVHGVDLRFFPYEPDCSDAKEWGFAEEMRIHRRMFRPETIGPDERPLPVELWVKSIDVELEPLRDFAERWDLYRSDQNPLGELDRHRWRAMDAVYATSAVWHMRKGRTLAIAGQARFVVIEDLTKTGTEAGRFLIYHWEDLGPNGERLTQACSP